jgi:hypothetical protein
MPFPPMRNSLLLLTTISTVAVTACQRLPSPQSADSTVAAAQAQAQHEAYERQLKDAADQTAQSEELLKRQIALQDVIERETRRQSEYLDVAMEQTKRMEALLQKWEEQAKRYDAILGRWEQQPAPGASSKP